MKIYQSAAEIELKSKKRKRIFFSILILFGVSLFVNFIAPKYPSEKLIDAVLKNDNQKIALLLKNRANPNLFYDKKGRTALRIAVEMQNPKAVRLLLEAGADPNHIYIDGSSVLMAAVFNTQLSLLNENIPKMLLDAGAKVNYLSKEKVSALMLACYMPNVKILELLIKAGAKVNVTEPLHHASALLVSLANDKDSPNTKFLKAKLLLQAGANVNYIINTPDQMKITALLAAAVFLKDYKLLKLLLKYKANPLIKDQNGNIPLDYLDSQKNPKIYRLLKKAAQKRLRS